MAAFDTLDGTLSLSVQTLLVEKISDNIQCVRIEENMGLRLPR